MRSLRRWFARTGATLTLLGIAVGTGVLAAAFLSAALYFALIEPLGKPLAALLTGGTLLAMAAMILLAVKFLIWSPRRLTTVPSEPDGEVAAARLGEMLAEDTGAWTKRHPGTAMATALVAGFAVGSSPRLRTLLLRLLR